MSSPSAGSSSSKKAEKAKRAQKGKELFDYHHGIHEEEDAKLTPKQLVKMIAEGRDFKKLRDTDKIKPKKKAEYQELVAEVPNLLKQPSRPLTELLNSTDPISTSEAMVLGMYLEGAVLTPDKMEQYLSIILYGGDVWLFGKHIAQTAADAAKTLETKYGPIAFDSTVPYKKEKAEAVEIAVKQYCEYRDGAIRENVYQLLWKGILMRQGSRDPENRVKQDGALAIAKILIQHGVPVDQQDVMGNTPLIYALGCRNPDLLSHIKFASILFQGGADVNHRNRQGNTALGMAAASSVTWGEDRKRSIPVQWLLQRGANPDVPDNSGFTPRMNGQYSKVITKLFKDEDKRRASLPPHCVFCLYIPPDDFEPGMEPVGGGPFLLKEKEPPRSLMLCACKSQRALYCTKKCQKADWKHHKKSCKLTKD